MRRDDLANETEATNVSVLDIGYTGITNDSSVNTSSRQISIADLFENNRSTYRSVNNSDPVRGRFYSSYDPEIGINTATVLGGLLLLLVIYVVYRTKIRKPILRVIHKCTMKYFPEEEFNPEKRQSLERVVEKPLDVGVTSAAAAAAEAEWISESAKMIWQERAKYSQDPDFEKCCLSEQRKCEEGEGNVCEARGETRNEPLANHLSEGANEHLSVFRLPDTKGNVQKATAQWVQNVKHLDRKDQQLNGIILKIPPDLVSHKAKVRSYFNSVTDYCDFDDFVSISSRNKSLPLLIDQQSFAKAYYASLNCVSKPGTEKRVDYAPIATQDEFDLDLRPSQLHVQHLSGSKVPLDICPIVKVQHFHSRSKRRLTSLTRTSSEESCNSSDDSGVPQAASTGQTKYIRLHTDECDASHADIKNTFQTQNNVQNNVAREVATGNYETCL